jgi:phosphoribosyl-AMP cyclohydrolase
MSSELEEGTTLQLDFDKLEKASAAARGILPVAVQHADTHELILVAYANRQALEHAIKTGNATFWSSSRAELWEKGAGEPRNCYYRRLNLESMDLEFIDP